MARGLLAEEVEQYQREGFVVARKLFGPEDLSPVTRAIDEICRQEAAVGEKSVLLEWEPAQDGGQAIPRRIYNPFEQHQAFRTLATDERVLSRIESLIGPDIGLHHSKLNMKPPRVGSAVEWHQDLAYFPHTNDSLVTTLVYLDDATEANGCLKVLPRCHDRFFSHDTADGQFAGMITEDICDGRFGEPVTLPAPAGSVIFMHCILPHASVENSSGAARRTMIFEYRAADSLPIYYSDRVAATEKHAHRLCGKPARAARFGGPPPYIPLLDGTKSLYSLQEETVAASRKSGESLPTVK